MDLRFSPADEAFRAEVRAYYDLEGMWSVNERDTKRMKAEHAGSAA